MKVIKFLSKRFAFDSTKEKVVGSLLSTIFIAAITWIINLVSDTGTVLKISALAVILLLFIIAKFYRPLFSNNKASLIMSFYIGIEMLWKFRPPESLFYGYSTFSIFLTAAALLVIFIFLPAFAFGSALSFLGGEPDTGIFKRTLPLCTGLFFTVYLFLPSETYFYNAMEIKYTYLDFAPYFLFKTAAFSLFSAFLLCQFKEKPRRFISDIMVGLIACISLTDFAATCLDEAGLYTKDDEPLLGRPVSQIGEDEERTRLVFQRPNFTHKGDVPAPPENYAYWLGYYYTGDKKELVKH